MGRGVGGGMNGREVQDEGEGRMGRSVGGECVGEYVWCVGDNLLLRAHVQMCDLFLRQSTSACLQELCRESIVNWR